MDTSELQFPRTDFPAFHIAYKWTRVPSRVRENQVMVALGWTVPADPAARSRVYTVELPAAYDKQDTSDVSGTLGLLHPVTSDKSETRASAFERSLSDLVKWLVMHELKPDLGSVVVIQGPMLPKLRGRFYYRGIGHINLLGMTFLPEWLAQVELAHTGATGDADDWALSAMYPPVPIDAGSRSWTAWRPNGLHLHFEALANLHSDAFDQDRADKWETTIAQILATCEESKDGLLVPARMLNAFRAAESLLARESLMLYIHDKLEEVDWAPARFGSNRVLAELEYLVRHDSSRHEAEEANPRLFDDATGEEKEAATRLITLIERRDMISLRLKLAKDGFYPRLATAYKLLHGADSTGAQE